MLGASLVPHAWRTLKLDPRDLYALGAHRGGIDERWFSSTTPADNGPGTPEDEGLSYIAFDSHGSGGRKILLREAIETLGDEFLGADVMSRYGGWNVLCKFFDNLGPIPHHMHQMEEHAAKVGRKGKPEAYYFPPQYNFKGNNFPTPSWALSPARRPTTYAGASNAGTRATTASSTTRRPTSSSPEPAGMSRPGAARARFARDLRATGQLGRLRDVSVHGRRPRRALDLLVKDVPPENHQDLDYIIGMLDWDAMSIPSL